MKLCQLIIERGYKFNIWCYSRVDTVKEVLDEMDAELRGNPLFASVEEMSQLELEARHRADNLINK